MVEESEDCKIVCLCADVHPCPIVFHEVSVYVPRGSDNSIAMHNREEQTLEGFDRLELLR